MKPYTDVRGDCRIFAWRTNAGKPSPTSGQRSARATLTVPLNRYACGMTVGHGWYKRLERVDQPGAEVRITGAWADGRLSVELPHGGFGVLGTSDVQVVDVSALTDDERTYLRALPPCSRVVAGELVGG
jgi:hypothetical protein